MSEMHDRISALERLMGTGSSGFGPESYISKSYAALIEQFARHQEQDLAMYREIANSQKLTDVRLDEVKVLMRELSVRLTAMEEVSGKIKHAWQFAVVLSLAIAGVIQVLFYLLHVFKGG